jgi:hypothetical protein
MDNTREKAVKDVIERFSYQGSAPLSREGFVRAVIEAYESALCQPIETVKDDGSVFDVWTTQGERICDCTFANFGSLGRRLCQPAPGGGYSYLCIELLTHWRPIPVPPSSEA